MSVRRLCWALGLAALLPTLLPVSRAGAQQGAGAQTTPPGGVPPRGVPPRGVPISKADLSKLPKSLPVPTTFEGLFAERDRRARDAQQYLDCLQTTVNALRSGALGTVPTAWSIACLRQGTEWRAVFGELNDDDMSVRLQVAIRGGRAVITRDRVDTAKAAGVARGVLRGLSAPLPGGGNYPLVPIALRQSSFVEVWFVAGIDDPTRALVGGDSLIQMSVDGKRELGHLKNAPPIRSLPITPANATWELPSLEERIPSMSELLAAHRALLVVPEVRVRTRQYDSVLRRGAAGWVHTRR